MNKNYKIEIVQDWTGAMLSNDVDKILSRMEDSDEIQHAFSVNDKMVFVIKKGKGAKKNLLLEEHKK